MKSKKINYKERLDVIFSEFIRLRDSANGEFRCISCDETKPYEQADCGHYINRQHMATRYHEMNCSAQCRKCNRFLEGNIIKYRKGLLKRYGEEAVDILEALQDTTRQIKEPEYKELIAYYKEKVKYLKNT